MSDYFKELSDGMGNAVENVTPSLVSVRARRRMPATGVIHSEDGVIVTAHHVVEYEEGIQVVTSDGTVHDATLVGRDPANDIAVLRVEASGLATIDWGVDDALKVGNLVLAVGKPNGQAQATLGVVSALVDESMMGKMRGGRGEKPKREGKDKRGWRDAKRAHRHSRRRARMMGRGRMLASGYIQTDVTMYPGFSGGPLLSGDGMAYGLNTSGFSRGASLAIPVRAIRSSVETLLTHGRVMQGYIGVGIQPVRLANAMTEELEQETGLLVTSVEDGTPAQDSGILIGDIIVALGDDSIEQLDDLFSALTSELVGKEVNVQVIRGGVLMTVSVTVAARP